MSSNGEPTVAIVGGGALGAAVFGLLLDRLAAKPWARWKARIALFEKGSRVGPGVAYARDSAPYLLNTSAQSMSIVPRKSSFHAWLVGRGLAVAEEREQFCARQLFGDYVEASFAEALERAGRAGIATTVVRDEVTDIAPRAGGGHRILTREHPSLDADSVVLAVGNLPTRRFRALAGPGFFASPYPSEAFAGRIPKDARVAILGTGLSAIDAAIALFAAGHEAPITMASRNGMLPSVCGPLHPFTLKHVTLANVERATDGGRKPLEFGAILGWLERELADHGIAVDWERDFPATSDARAYLASQIAAAEGTTRLWQSIGEALNPIIEVLWHHLSEDDRRLFLDRFHSRFTSHWVPIPLVTARRLFALVSAGKVKIARGLDEVTRADAEFSLRFGEERVAVDAVIHATGAPRRLDDTDSPLLDALVRQGTLTPHPQGGARVEFSSLRVIGEDGRAAPSLYALGHLTCGTHLFTSTLDRNVEKADRLATRIVDELSRRFERNPHVNAAADPA